MSSSVDERLEEMAARNITINRMLRSINQPGRTQAGELLILKEAVLTLAQSNEVLFKTACDALALKTTEPIILP